jgi:uncharacterized repeat protein (TIGR01451 family)
MKTGTTRLIMLAAIAAVLAFAGGAAAWAQCVSPNYSPDFTNGQACLIPNSNATFAVSNGLNVLQLTSSTGNQTGSAWYTVAQTVESGFSTSFQFQFTNPSTPPADGIAFVIQNSANPTAAIGFTGGNGGALAYGDADASTNPSTGAGIPNSLAIEFDTYENAWDPQAVNGSVSHVAVQSCGTGPNTSHHNQDCLGGSSNPSTLGAPVVTPNMADGAMHNVTITYYPACSTCNPATPANIHVMLDGIDLYPNGVNVDLSSIGLGEGGTAYVGLTGATGGDFETQNILNWTYTQNGQAQTVTTTAPTVFNIGGGFANGGSDFTAQLLSGSPVTVQVNPISGPSLSPAACNALIQPSFPGAQCFVQQNGGGPGVDATVMIEVTCPESPTGGTCGSISQPTFLATLGTDFSFIPGENPPLALFNGNPLGPLQASGGNPYIGFLKGSGPDPLDPCAPFMPASNPLNTTMFTNQVISFTLGDTSSKPTKGGSSGTGSCWIVTYLTPGETPTVTVTSPANGGTYQQGQTTQANYTCTTVNNSGVAGPYLTQASCSATDSPGGSVAQGAQFDTTTLGPHTFTATVVDSATNTASQTVTYNVVAATNVAISNAAFCSKPPASCKNGTPPGSKLTYVIGVGDLGPANAVNVVVADTLAPGTSFVSASGTNIGFPCTKVGGKVTCTVTSTAINCTVNGNLVICPVGTIMPVSLFDLNGALIDITVQVSATASKNTILSNTATVTQSNAETKQDNSQTVTTTVN